METNFREMLDLGTLTIACGVAKEARTLRHRKAIRNIRYCANDQWGYVNSWLDHRDESARAYVMNARELFDTIYDESLKNVYDEGSVHFGSHCESYLKEIKFCGKNFLQRVCLYYTAALLEDSIWEVEGTEEDATRIYNDLLQIKNSIV